VLPVPLETLSGTDDLVATLDSVLSMAHTLISGGPWWQEAKACHPLILVDALHDTSTVSCHVLHHCMCTHRPSSI
jgi:hypothetical protein